MDLSSLKPAAGSVKTRKRIGRGPGSGLGGTSTRGHKGAKSRSGYSKKILSTLQTLAETKSLSRITKADLIEAGLIGKNDLVKILGNGTLSLKLEVEANAFSKSAEAAIIAQGGSAVKL